MNINFEKVEIILSKQLTNTIVENARLQALLDDALNENKRLQDELNDMKSSNTNEKGDNK